METDLVKRDKLLSMIIDINELAKDWGRVQGEKNCSKCAAIKERYEVFKTSLDEYIKSLSIT